MRYIQICTVLLLAFVTGTMAHAGTEPLSVDEGPQQ